MPWNIGEYIPPEGDTGLVVSCWYPQHTVKVLWSMENRIAVHDMDNITSAN